MEKNTFLEGNIGEIINGNDKIKIIKPLGRPDINLPINETYNNLQKISGRVYFQVGHVDLCNYQYLFAYNIKQTMQEDSEISSFNNFESDKFSLTKIQGFNEEQKKIIIPDRIVTHRSGHLTDPPPSNKRKIKRTTPVPDGFIEKEFKDHDGTKKILLFPQFKRGGFWNSDDNKEIEIDLYLEIKKVTLNNNEESLVVDINYLENKRKIGFPLKPKVISKDKIISSLKGYKKK